MYKITRDRVHHSLTVMNLKTKEEKTVLWFGDHWSIEGVSLNETISFRWTRLLPSFHGQGTMYVDNGLMEYLNGAAPLRHRTE